MVEALIFPDDSLRLNSRRPAGALWRLESECAPLVANSPWSQPRVDAPAFKLLGLPTVKSSESDRQPGPNRAHWISFVKSHTDLPEIVGGRNSNHKGCEGARHCDQVDLSFGSAWDDPCQGNPCQKFPLELTLSNRF